MATFLQADNQTALILIVEGLGHIDGGGNIVADTFSTHPLTSGMESSIATELGAVSIDNNIIIEDYPTVSSVRMGILDTISSDAGWGMMLSAGPNQETRSLLDYEQGSFHSLLPLSVVPSSRRPVIVTAPILAAATSIAMNDNTTINVGDIAIIDGEAMEVTSKPSTIVTNVTREILGTKKKDHPMGLIPFNVWIQSPTVNGMRIRLYEIDSTDTTLPSTPIYRGRIDSISTNDSGSLNISVSSLWSQVFNSKWTCKMDTISSRLKPIAQANEDGNMTVWNPFVDEISYFSSMDYLIIWIGSKWVMTQYTWVALPPITDINFNLPREQWYIEVGNTIAYGEEDGVINYGPIPGVLVDGYKGQCSLGYGISLTSNSDKNIDGIIEGLLTGTFPSGKLAPPNSFAGLDDNDIGGLSRLSVLPIGEENGPYGVILAPSKDKTLGDYLSDQFLRPAALGLSIGSEGKVHGIEWALSLDQDITLEENDLASDSYTSTKDQASALLSVDFQAENLKMISAANSVYNNTTGQNLEIKPGTFSNRGIFEQLWRNSVFAYWEVAHRLITLSIRNSKDPIVGQIAGINIPRLPNQHGLVDQSAASSDFRLGRILEVTRNLRTAEKRITISFGAYVKDGDNAKWGPSAEVQFNQVAGDTTIEITKNFFAINQVAVSRDAEAFWQPTYDTRNDVSPTYPTIRVDLYDKYLTLRSDNHPRVTSISLSINDHLNLDAPFKNGGVDLAINDGDIIISTVYTNEDNINRDFFQTTWWTDDAGELGGVNPGRRYA